MFCRQQAAEFRLHQPEHDALGVNLVFIGNGLPAMADDFIEEHHLKNPVWTDRAGHASLMRTVDPLLT